MRVADYVLKQLENFGVEDVFFLPGGGAMYLDDAIAKSRMNAICCLHEQSTGIAAEAYGRFHPSKLGVAIVTSGPGSTNVLTPVAGAWIESNPLLIISGQVKTSDINIGERLRQSGVQEINIISMVKGITKYAKQLSHPLEVKEVLEKCILDAISGRKGPSWMDIPLDVQAYTLPDGYPDIVFKALQGQQAEGKKNIAINLLIEAKKLISESQRPILLVGQGARESQQIDLLEKFITELQIPTIVTFPALDLLDYQNKFFIGRPGGVSIRSANFAVQNSDLLISIGSSLNNVITAYNPAGFADKAKKIIVDIDVRELEKHKYANALLIESCASQFMNEILDHNEADSHKTNNKRSEWVSFCNDLKNKYSNEHQKFVDVKNEYISHYEVVTILSEILPEGLKIATGSSGLCIEVFYAYFKNKKNQRICITSGMGSMGYGLPVAIGMSSAMPAEKIFCYEGDGSLQMNIQEFALVSGKKLPIVFIIINNGGYASIRNTQNNYFEGRLVGTGLESGLHLPNLSGLADGYGIRYISAKSTQELKKALYIGIDAIGPLIIEVFVNPEEKLYPKVQAHISSSGEITSMPIEDMSPLLDINELKESMKYTQIKPSSYAARGLKKE